MYSTAYIQIYKKTLAILCDLKNFEDNLRVELVRYKKYTAREWLLLSCKCL